MPSPQPFVRCCLLAWAAVSFVIFSANVQAQPAASPIAGTAAAHVSSASEFAPVLRDAGKHLAGIANAVSPAVVNIDSTHESRSGTVEETGSGVIMKSPRVPWPFVITNRHVVGDAPLGKIEILLYDGRIVHPVQKLEDPDSDLAVLQLEETGISPAQFGDSDNLDIGHFVLAMGSPFGLSQSVTLGIISAKGRRSLELPGRKVINQDFLQTDAAINPGNSGGPLIDLNGRVVGINTAIASQGGGNEGIAFSIPSNLVQVILAQLLDHGRVIRAYLGVELDDTFDADAARRYALPRNYGARVVRLPNRSPAANAGIRPGDIILNFNGVDVEDHNDLINRVSLAPVNERVRIVLWRDGRQVSVFVQLIERQIPKETSQLTPPNGLHDPARIENAGLSVLRLQQDISVQMGFSPSQHGVLVKQVADANPDADHLNVYDVIEEVARQPIASPEDLDRVVAEHSKAARLVVKVRRVVDGKTVSRLVLWERRPEQE